MDRIINVSLKLLDRLNFKSEATSDNTLEPFQ